MRSDKRIALSDDGTRTGITRRVALRKFGTTGLFATAGAGILALIGARSAKADPFGVTTINGVPWITSTMNPANASCCTTCTRAEFHCDGGVRCPTGACCFFCDGCGLNGFYCIGVSCANQTYRYCN